MKCKTDFSFLIIIKHFKVLHIPQCQLYFTFYFHHARPESKKRDRQIDKERRETGKFTKQDRRTDGQRHVFLFSTVSVWYITGNKLLFVCLLSLPHMLRACVCLCVFYVNMCYCFRQSASMFGHHRHVSRVCIFSLCQCVLVCHAAF